MTEHVPVLCSEVVELLTSQGEQRVVIDATFGRGGHAQALLNADSNVRVLAVDRDAEAVAYGKNLEGRYDGRLTVVHERFANLKSVWERFGHGRLAGILMDLGVSSPQLETPNRGFSFQHDGPLDMRMGLNQRTAADVLETSSEDDLAFFFKEYGDEPEARLMARAIVQQRNLAPVKTTLELVALIEKTTRFWKRKMPRSALIFQALRLVVNDELLDLQDALAASETLLPENGRLVVMAFHSLEDRLVKRFLAERTDRRKTVRAHDPKHPSPLFKNGGALVASESEQKCNPRARSVRLRWADRTEETV